MGERHQRAKARGTEPYFLRDNPKYTAGKSPTPKPEPSHTPSAPATPPKPSIAERAQARHNARTPQQIAEIQKRWDDRKRIKELELRQYTRWNKEQLVKEIKSTNITPKELRLIDGDMGGKYTKTPTSWTINTALREGRLHHLGPEEKEAVSALDDVIARNRLQEDIICYRYDSYNLVKVLSNGAVSNQKDVLNFFQSLEGKVIQDNGYRSVSSVEGLNVFDFYPIRLNIRVPAGTNAYVANNAQESEIVLGRGSKIKILSSQQVGTKVVIECLLL